MVAVIYKSYIVYIHIKKEVSMNKLIKFTPEMVKKIQDYANKRLNGNFTMAVVFICAEGLKVVNEGE